MSYRSYVKIGRRAEFEGRYTSRVNPADASGGGGGTGADGKDGKDGKDGEGVPTGGDTGQVLAKIDGADFNTEWVDSSSDTSDLEDRITLLEKALFPYVEFTDEARSLSYYAGASYQNPSVRMYQYWSTSPAGEWMWAWMIKFPGTDTWTDVDDLSSAEQASIGYDGTEDGVYLMLYPTDPSDMPDIEVSLKVTDSLEGFDTAEGWSDPFFPRDVWINQGTVFSTQKQLPIKRGRKLWLTQDLQLNTQ